MFSIIDILTISIIIILLAFLFFLFQIEKILAKPRIYLRSAIIILTLIAVLEELIYMKQYVFLIWIYPLIILGYFSIYPLIYVYSENLVYGSNDIKRFRPLYAFVFPIIVFILVSAVYYPLNYVSKIEFIRLHLWESRNTFKEHNLFLYIVTPAYYTQTVLYMAATVKLVYVVKNNISSKPWELALVKYLVVYVASVCVVEILIAINSLIFSDINKILTWEQVLSLVFLSLSLYIGIKQSLIIVQVKLNQYSDKLLDSPNDFLQLSQKSKTVYALTENNDVKVKNNVKSRLTEIEKLEIKNAIKNYFNDTKIYLDPNLKLENLSKKLHITSRRISIVINEVYETNFNQFINEYRIAEAVYMISQNPQNAVIENIYTKVGFNSRSAFNNAFKESLGISPIEHLKKVITEQAMGISKM
jgi:AraC-like DNA-binding protein